MSSDGVASQSVPTWNQIVTFLKNIDGLRAAGVPAA
jgi:hypothetical protein